MADGGIWMGAAEPGPRWAPTAESAARRSHRHRDRSRRGRGPGHRSGVRVQRGQRDHRRPASAAETGDVVADEIVQAGGRALSLRCDVSVRADVEAAVASAIEHFGGLDSMIHNALSFVGEPHEIQDVPPEIWQSMVETGLRATYYCA